MEERLQADVTIIGAGPSGAVAACLLRRLGYSVHVLERTHFPRFVIGESLLPQCLQNLEKAGCLEAVAAAGFQSKTGARFQHKGHFESIVFDDKFSQGPGTAFHVKRAEFDQILAQCAKEQGADIMFGMTVTSVDLATQQCQVEAVDENQVSHIFESKFVLDASGYGRVLPRLLGINKPSELSPKSTLFSHIKDNISDPDYRRAETLITTHPQHRDVWYWLISFSDGTSSIGVVGPPEHITPFQEQGIEGLKQAVNQDPYLSGLLGEAVYHDVPRQLNAYSGNVSDFWGDGFAVLGNAGEFLDPIFSSGVTVAMQSSDLAVRTLHRHLQGENPDWDKEYVAALRQGIETFKCYVNGWYSGDFQDVIYSHVTNHSVKSKIASILAGYAWDVENPYVAQPQKRLNALVALCQE